MRTGEVLGTAGGGLRNAPWAVNADVAAIGRRGEEKTGEILDRLAANPNGPTILHDLMIPGYRANIDHVIISGNAVTLVDTKVWKPGRYWRLFSVTRRGLERFPSADKRTMQLAVAKIAPLLAGLHAAIKPPLIVVWSNGPASFFNMNERTLPALNFAARARTLVGHRPANQRIVNALIPLLSS